MRLKSSIAITGRGEFKRTSGSFDRFSGRTIFAVGFDVQSQMSLTMPPSKIGKRGRGFQTAKPCLVNASGI
ncbi:hypothetical protein AU082_12245 [Yersinia pestis]|nr:hypothetical protein AU082_12245 [Yersinia pestis]